jgi:hypothetical protein
MIFNRKPDIDRGERVGILNRESDIDSRDTSQHVPTGNIIQFEHFKQHGLLHM